MSAAKESLFTSVVGRLLMGAVPVDGSQWHVPITTGSKSVSSDLRYIVPMGQKPQSLEYEPPPGVPRSTAVFEEHEADIRDLRPIASYTNVDREGFQLLTSPTAVEDFSNTQAITEIYYNEVIKLLKKQTGASRVVVFDHTIRRKIPGATDRSTGIPRQPVSRIHNDYTEKSGPQRVRDLMGDEAEALLKKRFAVVNVWRPINGPVQDMPLAVADARTVQQDDLVPVDLIYRDRVGEIYYVKHNPEHRWHYAPDMTNDEVLLIKCYDSLTDGTARFVPHTAFADPTTPANAPPRESIEIRTLLFFD